MVDLDVGRTPASCTTSAEWATWTEKATVRVWTCWLMRPVVFPTERYAGLSLSYPSTDGILGAFWYTCHRFEIVVRRGSIFRHHTAHRENASRAIWVAKRVWLGVEVFNWI